MSQLNRLGKIPILALFFVGCSSFLEAAMITRLVNVTLNASNLESYNLDVDLNGTNDFKFTASNLPDPVLPIGSDVVDFPFGGNNGGVIDAFAADRFPNATRLNTGDLVSVANLFSSASFDQANLFSFVGSETPSGNFEGQTGFLGLRFDGSSGPLYGFAEVSVNSRNSSSNPLGLTIGLVGYNDAVGQPALISAAVPEPTSLLLLGIGTIGIVSSRFTRNRTKK